MKRTVSSVCEYIDDAVFFFFCNSTYPRTVPDALSSSRAFAMASASGLVSTTAWTVSFTCPMRARYA